MEAIAQGTALLCLICAGAITIMMSLIFIVQIVRDFIKGFRDE